MNEVNDCWRGSKRKSCKCEEKTGKNGESSCDCSSSENAAQVLLQQQQRLLILRHSFKCRHVDAANPCPTTPFCIAMKELWRHMMDCKDQTCEVAHCISSRCILAHYQHCRGPCDICVPVREALQEQNVAPSPVPQKALWVNKGEFQPADPQLYTHVHDTKPSTLVELQLDSQEPPQLVRPIPRDGDKQEPGPVLRFPTPNPEASLPFLPCVSPHLPSSPKVQVSPSPMCTHLKRQRISVTIPVGGWQSDADFPDRQNITKQIVHYLMNSRINARPQWVKQLPTAAQHMEDMLYRRAASFEEYSDQRTLMFRVQALAHELGRKTLDRHRDELFTNPDDQECQHAHHDEHEPCPGQRDRELSESSLNLIALAMDILQAGSGPEHELVLKDCGPGGTAQSDVQEHTEGSLQLCELPENASTKKLPEERISEEHQQTLCDYLSQLSIDKYHPFFIEELGMLRITEFGYLSPNDWNRIKSRLSGPELNRLRNSLGLPPIPERPAAEVEAVSRFLEHAQIEKHYQFIVEEIGVVRPEEFGSLFKKDWNRIKGRMSGPEFTRLRVSLVMSNFSLVDFSETKEEGLLCAICLDQIKSTVLLPCKHLCLCNTCACNSILTQCPVCCKEIKDKMTVVS